MHPCVCVCVKRLNFTISCSASSEVSHHERSFLIKGQAKEIIFFFNSLRCYPVNNCSLIICNDVPISDRPWGGSGGTEVISSQFRIPLSPNCVMLRKYSLLDLASLNWGGERYGDDGCLCKKGINRAANHHLLGLTPRLPTHSQVR